MLSVVTVLAFLGEFAARPRAERRHGFLDVRCPCFAAADRCMEWKDMRGCMVDVLKTPQGGARWKTTHLGCCGSG